MSLASIQRELAVADAAKNAEIKDTKEHNACNQESSGDAEIQSMLDEFDLLDLIKSDTGESGRESCDRIGFKECPICGHRDCFSFYPDTNSWCCFSESNDTGYNGGTALEYYKATRNANNAEAVRWLREETGHPYEPKSDWNLKSPDTGKGDTDTGEDTGEDGFPSITSCKVAKPPKRAPVLIDGVLRRGHTLLVTARSKAGKTFLMIQLAVAISCGSAWLGHQCEQGRVLFVNPEVDPPSAENRLHDVVKGMSANLDLVGANVDFWHLRGHVQGIEEMAKALFKRAKHGDYDMVILDSVYELYDGDENSAEDARKFFHWIDKISKELGCAVAMTHHHAKGARSDLDALDRGSGSGVFGRKPDAPIDLIQIFPPSEDENPLDEGVTAWRVTDSGLREFPSLKPFDVLFDYPIHVPVEGGLTDGWKPKSPQQKGGKKTGAQNKQKSSDRAIKCEKALAAEFMASGVCKEGIPASEAAEIVSNATGETVKTQTLKKYIESSDIFDVNQKSPQRWSVVPKKLPPEPQPTLDLSS